MGDNTYYCLIAGLPELHWEEKKVALTLASFKEQAASALSPRDMALVNLFFLPADHRALISLLKKERVEEDPLRVFAVADMEAELRFPSGTLFPEYLNAWLNKYRTVPFEDEVAAENELGACYYRYLATSKNAFVRRISRFQERLKNVTAAFTARKYGMDLASQVVGDDDFAEALRSSKQKDFGLTIDFPFVERVITLMNNPRLLERERDLDLMVWNEIETLCRFEYATIERLLGYFIELQILDRWSRIDDVAGHHIFMQLLDQFRAGFQNQNNQNEI